jgi:hypothetical protein
MHTCTQNLTPLQRREAESDSDCEQGTHAGPASGSDDETKDMRARPSSQALHSTLAALVAFLQRHQVYSQPELAEHAAAALAHIARDPSPQTASADLALQGLRALCAGPPAADACVEAVLRQLLQTILMKFTGAYVCLCVTRRGEAEIQTELYWKGG